MSWEAVGEFVQSTYPVLCEKTQDMWSADLLLGAGSSSRHQPSGSSSRIEIFIVCRE